MTSILALKIADHFLHDFEQFYVIIAMITVLGHQKNFQPNVHHTFTVRHLAPDYRTGHRDINFDRTSSHNVRTLSLTIFPWVITRCTVRHHHDAQSVRLSTYDDTCTLSHDENLRHHTMGIFVITR